MNIKKLKERKKIVTTHIIYKAVIIYVISTFLLKDHSNFNKT
jgi:hypothetical protein